MFKFLITFCFVTWSGKCMNKQRDKLIQDRINLKKICWAKFSTGEKDYEKIVTSLVNILLMMKSCLE